MGDIVSIKIEAWWLLLVPLLLILTLFIIALIMKYSPDEEKNEKKTLTSWITNKDILYWSLIVCLGAIGIFTFQYKSSADVISHWGFAGTIVSIILAVIAIGFTLFQTLTHSLSSEKIGKSADRIEKASTGLGSTELLQAVEIIKDTSQNIAGYNLQVEEKLGNLTEELLTIKDSQLESSGKFDALISIQEDSVLESSEKSDLDKNKIEMDVDIDIDIDDFMENVFPGFGMMTRYFLYIVLLLSETDVLTEKKKRTNFLVLITNHEIEVRFKGKVLEGQANNNRKYYVRGMNLGFLTAAENYGRQIGILKAFKSKDEESIRVLLKKAEKGISSKRLEFLEQFIEPKR